MCLAFYNQCRMQVVKREITLREITYCLWWQGESEKIIQVIISGTNLQQRPQTAHNYGRNDGRRWQMPDLKCSALFFFLASFGQLKGRGHAPALVQTGSSCNSLGKNLCLFLSTSPPHQGKASREITEL